MRVQLRYLFGDNGRGLHPQFAFDASLKVHSDGLFLCLQSESSRQLQRDSKMTIEREPFNLHRGRFRLSLFLVL